MQRGFVSIVLLGILGLVASPASAADQIDVAPLDQLLHATVHEDQVDYHAVAQQRQQLDAYLNQAKDLRPELFPTAQAQMAFWINTYNATVIKAVIDHAPVRSVKEISGFFDKLRYPVAGQQLTLNEIEARGRALGDSRIHYGIVCASSSCPPIRAEAYQPDRVIQQLEDQARRFLNNPSQGVRVDGTTLWASKIFDWYAADFMPSGRFGVLHRPQTADVAPVILPYLEPALAQQVQAQPLKLKFMAYDWTLNHIRDSHSFSGGPPGTPP